MSDLDESSKRVMMDWHDKFIHKYPVRSVPCVLSSRSADHCRGKLYKELPAEGEFSEPDPESTAGADDKATVEEKDSSKL